MKKALIVGSGGHARAISSCLVLNKNYYLEGIIDINFSGKSEKINDVNVIGNLEILSKYIPYETFIFIAIGNNNERKMIFEKMKNKGFNLPNLIHPSSFVTSSAIIGNGNFIGPFAHIGPNVSLGNANIINTNSNLEHEVSVGSYVHCAPNSTICGRSNLHDLVFVGASATITPGITVNIGTVIGAGSVIINNISECDQTYVGVPGKRK